MSFPPRPARPIRARRLVEAGKGEIGSAEDRRAMLLDCAARLQDWPIANHAYRERLDSVACELVRMASAVADSEGGRTEA